MEVKEGEAMVVQEEVKEGGEAEQSEAATVPTTRFLRCTRMNRLDSNFHNQIARGIWLPYRAYFVSNTYYICLNNPTM